MLHRRYSRFQIEHHANTMADIHAAAATPNSNSSRPPGRPDWNTSNNSHRACVLLVGSGRMGQIRAKAIYANPRFELCGIVDSNVDAAAKLGEMYHVS